MHRIQLGNRAFEGRNNAYLLAPEGPGPTTLVDTGVATPETRRQLSDGLAEHGVEFADVDQVLLTHWHEDHAGLAGHIQSAGGATVRAHVDDAPLVEGDPDATAALSRRQEDCFTEWGMPTGPRRELEAFFEQSEDAAGERATVTPFEDGDVLSVGDLDLEAVHLPGHTAGLAGFVVDGDRRELFSGDALLPHYTPNVGGADVRVDRPLARYLDTLVRIAEGGFDRALPGHRHVIDDPAGRARDIVDHHRERTGNVVDVLASHGPADAWTVSSHLFGDLANIHILHGPGESYAHLAHLEAHGLVERTDDGYVLREAEPDLDALFPDLPGA